MPPANTGAAFACRRHGDVSSETCKLLRHCIARGENSAKAGRAVYISSATRPMNHLDALPLLLDSILDGDDVTLIDEGDQGRTLLDLAAGCLAGMRSRIVRAADVLPDIPGVPVPSPRPAGPSKASLPNDALLTQSFKALTTLDQSCDRIVLLVSDAHALQHPILRYIQFVSRSGTNLQLVFCGKGKFFGLLNSDEFAWLHERLLAGLIVTVAAPVAKAASLSSIPPSVPDGPATWVGKAAVPLLGLPSPAASTNLPSRVLWLGGLVLFGLGGAAWLALDLQNGKADGPTTTKQAAAVMRSSPTPKPSAASAPEVRTPGGTASHADSEAEPAVPAASPRLPDVAANVQGTAPGSPSSIPFTPLSTAASGALGTVQPPTKAGMPKSEPDEPRPSESLPSLARNLGQQGVPADPSRTAATQSPTTLEPPANLTSGTQIPDETASHAASEASFAPNTQALHSPLTPQSTAASGALTPKWPQAKVGVPESKPNVPLPPDPLPSPARNPGQQIVPATPSRTAAAAPGIRTHRLKEPKAQSAPLPVDDRWLASQPTSGSSEPPGGGSPQYIGSYAVDANGVRMFHLEP